MINMLYVCIQDEILLAETDHDVNVIAKALVFHEIDNVRIWSAPFESIEEAGANGFKGALETAFRIYAPRNQLRKES